MSQPQLTVVSSTPAEETTAQRIKRLQAEAHALAREQIQALESALEVVTNMSVEIAEGGEAHPVGARDLCRRLAEEASFKSQTLEAIMQKNA